jgi:hypothetical protein
MKMVKSLLLGSAATFVAAAGAQAADLPMKAKAVEYVKVCSLYGAGYYYIPGTDTCIKIGGFVRFDTVWNGAPSGATTFVTGADARFNAAETRYYDWRTRLVLTMDTRSQTEYGTLRSYIRAGWQYTTGAAPSSQGEATFPKDAVNYVDRGLIQFAGFTFGKTQSFFDVWAATGVANANLWGYDDTGNGINLAAYTAMLGNGVSLSIAAEDPQAYRRMNLYRQGGGLAFAGVGTNNYGGTEIPDIVGTLRVDQAWGSAMVGGLVHQIRGTYYQTGASATGTTANGRPDDKWGWAVTGGLDLNLPWAKGDRFIVQGTYTEGVMGTVMGGINNTSIGIWRGQSATDVTVGWIVDATRGTSVVEGGTTGDWRLTTGWAVIAGLEHYWVPNLRSSVYGSYVAVRYPGTSTVAGDGKNNICADVTGLAAANCNPDLNLWNVGTRTVWSPVPNLDVSLEAVYSYVDQNNAGTTTLAAGAMPNNVARTIVDQGVWAFNFRVQRNFWP